MLKLFVLFGAFVLSFSQETENNGTFGGTVNGGDLVQLGRELNKPMLTIIGMALRNLQSCEWTQWSPCSARKLGHFGSRTRTRECNHDNGDGNTDSVIESDNELCEGNCPMNYTFTTHGYCIKYYKEAVTWDDAATQCRNDGGYLINVETKQKHDDIKEMMKGITSTYPYVGGRRKDVSSPWIFEYGKQDGFLDFYPGQPDNRSDELCLYLHYITGLLYDTLCTFKYPFLCEIII